MLYNSTSAQCNYNKQHIIFYLLFKYEYIICYITNYIMAS